MLALWEILENWCHGRVQIFYRMFLFVTPSLTRMN